MQEKVLKEKIEDGEIVASRFDHENDKIFFLVKSSDGKLKEYNPSQQQLHSFINFLASQQKEVTVN